MTIAACLQKRLLLFPAKLSTYVFSAALLKPSTRWCLSTRWWLLCSELLLKHLTYSLRPSHKPVDSFESCCSMKAELWRHIVGTFCQLNPLLPFLLSYTTPTAAARTGGSQKKEKKWPTILAAIHWMGQCRHCAAAHWHTLSLPSSILCRQLLSLPIVRAHCLALPCRRRRTYTHRTANLLTDYSQAHTHSLGFCRLLLKKRGDLHLVAVRVPIQQQCPFSSGTHLFVHSVVLLLLLPPAAPSCSSNAQTCTLAPSISETLLLCACVNSPVITTPSQSASQPSSTNSNTHIFL